MPTSYRGQVAVAFEILAEGLAAFLDEHMSTVFPDEDWILMAATKLGKRRDVLVSLSDPHFQLEVLNRWWGPAFSADLSEDLRSTITELRTARNHWAHPDEDHPFDLDYATRVHLLVEDLLRAIDSPLVSRAAEAAESLRWAGIRDVARERGVPESEVVLHQLAVVQKEYDELRSQLDEARAQARSATGRSQAVARQLAALQSQYAAVAGLHDQYEVLQRQLEEERRTRDREFEDTSTVRAQLAANEQTLEALRDQSRVLQDELASARVRVETVDPVMTAEGRRWIWLVAALISTLAILLAVTATSLGR
jgi:hypothetical protein